MRGAPPTPRWLPIVGWVLIVVGVLSAIGDVTRSGTGLGSSLGAPGLVLDLLLDAFLIGGGLLIVASTRR